MKEVSLALSGGGIRAIAHLGIVEVLQGHGVELAALSGSSGGALVGSMLCDGMKPKEIVQLVKEVRPRTLFGKRRGGGFFGLDRIEALLKESLSCENIEDLSIPFIVACTDLAAGKVRYFAKGELAKLCIASSSLVPIFSPVRYEGDLLADGGFMDNMPAKPLKTYGRPIVGINVNPIVPKKPETILHISYRALVLMMAANIEASKKDLCYFIEPAACEKIALFDLKKVEEAYEVGLREGERVVPQLLRRLGEARSTL